MSIENNNNSNFNDKPGQPNPGQPNKEGTFSMEYRHQPVSARVPERVARGVMSTGVLVLDGPNEFVIDFLQGLTRPLQIAARVVITPPVMEQLVHALKDNIGKYEQRFGPPPALPKPPTDRRPTLQEIYDEFKLSDDQLSGTYANAVMVGHSPSEFFFDFITNFYPTSAVSARVFMSAAQAPRVLDALGMAYGRFQQRMATFRQQQMGQQVIQHPSLTQPPMQHPPVQSPPPVPPAPPLDSQGPQEPQNPPQ